MTLLPDNIRYTIIKTNRLDKLYCLITYLCFHYVNTIITKSDDDEHEQNVDLKNMFDEILAALFCLTSLIKAIVTI